MIEGRTYRLEAAADGFGRSMRAAGTMSRKEWRDVVNVTAVGFDPAEEEAAQFGGVARGLSAASGARAAHAFETIER